MLVHNLAEILIFQEQKKKKLGRYVSFSEALSMYLTQNEKKKVATNV